MCRISTSRRVSGAPLVTASDSGGDGQALTDQREELLGRRYVADHADGPPAPLGSGPDEDSALVVSREAGIRGSGE